MPVFKSTPGIGTQQRQIQSTFFMQVPDREHGNAAEKICIFQQHACKPTAFVYFITSYLR